MLTSNKSKWVLFIASFSVISLAFFLVENYTVYVPIHPILFISFCITAIIVALWPLSLGQRKYLILQWLTVPIMLRYGILYELLIYQIAIIPFLWRVNTKNSRLRFLPIYSCLFFFLPLTAYFILFLAGLRVGQLTFYEILVYATLYQVLITLFYYSSVYYLLRLNGIKHTFYVRKESLVMLFTIPVIVALYYLFDIIGSLASLLILMFYLILSVLMKSLSISLIVNENLNFVVKVSQKLSVCITRQQALTLFMDSLMEIKHVDEAYLIHDKDGQFELLCSKTSEHPTRYIHEHTNYVAEVYRTGQFIYLSNYHQWALTKCPFPFRKMESLVFIPLKRDEHVVAALIVASKNRRAFEQYQIKLLDLLAANLAISLGRIRFIENTISKSERCALTNLYNYRYLDDQIHAMTRTFDSGSISKLSVLMIDIDHFKTINDTYGHESGNIIIKTLAMQLQELVDETMVLARYGGEEFVILMPNKDKEVALLFAEKIRQKTALTAYKVVTELDEKRAELSIYITLSIGVSSVPEDTKDIQRLLANADRALYVGAKRSGRNRVAAYSEGI